MSVHVSSAVWKITGISPSQKLILLKLADHADDDGRCWPSIRRMSQETCLGKSTVFRQLREMEEAGWLQRVQRAETSTVYRLMLSQIVPGSLKTSDGEGGVVPQRDQGGVVPPWDQGGPTAGQGVVPQRDRNHHLEPSSEPPIHNRAKKPSGAAARKDRTADEIALANLVDLDLLSSDALKTAWSSFKGYRAERAKRPLSGEKLAPWTERAALMQKRTLERIVAKWGESIAIEQVTRSVDRRWIDIYEPKNQVDKQPDPKQMSLAQLKEF